MLIQLKNSTNFNVAYSTYWQKTFRSANLACKKKKKIFFKDLIKKQFWRPTQKQDTAFQSSKRKAAPTNKLCLILIRKNILFFCHSIKRWWQRCQHYLQLKPICLPPPLIRKECMQQQNYNQNRNLWQQKKLSVLTY